MDAVLDLLAEGTPIDTLSVEAIAARAGVGKATIYRRWSGKETLLLDALRTLKGPPPVPAGRSVREDLVALLQVVHHEPDARAARVLPCLLPGAWRSPEQDRLYQELVEPRREALRAVLRRGVANGELRADLDIELTVALLAGPILMQRLLRAQPDLDETDLPERVVASVLAGIGRH